MRAVLFDFDGTVVDLNFKYAESRVAIIKVLKESNFDTSIFSLYDTAQAILEKIKKQIEERSMNIKLSEIKGKIWSIIDEFEIEAINASKLVKETKSILNFLSEKGIRTGLVTNSGRKAVQLALIKHGLSFDVIVTRDEMDKLKPYGDGIKLALRIINVPTENAIYIGDSINDVLAAKDANVCSIAINRFSSIEKLRKPSPDYIVNSLSEAMNLLKRFLL
ncbi:MAG: HAD family hydrolase [Nitrososphaerales archaeon]